MLHFTNRSQGVPYPVCKNNDNNKQIKEGEEKGGKKLKQKPQKVGKVTFPTSIPSILGKMLKAKIFQLN